MSVSLELRMTYALEVIAKTLKEHFDKDTGIGDWQPCPHCGCGILDNLDMATEKCPCCQTGISKKKP